MQPPNELDREVKVAQCRSCSAFGARAELCTARYPDYHDKVSARRPLPDREPSPLTAHGARIFCLYQISASSFICCDCCLSRVRSGRDFDRRQTRVHLCPDRDDEDRLICSVACIASRGDCGLRKPAAQLFAQRVSTTSSFVSLFQGLSL